MKRLLGILLLASLALAAAADETALVLDNRLGATAAWRVSVEGETARLEIAAGAPGWADLAADRTVRVGAAATRWIVAAGPVAVEAAAGEGLRVLLARVRFQGVEFVELAVLRGETVEAKRTVYLPLASDDLETRRARLAEEVRRQEVELDIARLEARLAWIADERRRLYLPPPGSLPYAGYGPVYSFTYGSFGYPAYGGLSGHGHGHFHGGLDFGFFYRGDDFFLGFGTHHH